MSNVTRLEYVLRIVVLVSLLVGAWALALNQISNFVENGREAKLAVAAAECIEFLAPHAIIDAEGEIYCYTTYEGTEQIAPLSYLRQTYGTGRDQ